MSAPYRIVADGLELDLRLTPKGGRDGFDGVARLADGRAVLLARVRAAPEDDAANAALLRLVAEALARPRSAVTLAAGRKARLKTLRIEGDGAALAAAVERIGAAA
jgi:uncharacterized protein YggU (UPF0235/DUF167 family)